ncbi:nucleoside phosphorylase [Trichlorobacter sp.]|uniref:phosphorylase family protein n=1 Tax=Trichlorobacter sp. TaxID=2911007 RepID=UPI002A3637F7|nr:nucleoside phosphorylase [Trichlorobacter sp.]MDY0384269.1 nucleoside phosphorylase [Trichlorobacter sp.]
MIGIVTALPEERAAVLKAMRQTTREQQGGLLLYRGVLAGRELCLIEGGMGTSAAARASKTLITACKPTLLISAGYCGAVRPGPATGDLVLCSRLLTADQERVQELLLPGSEQAAARLAAELQRFGLRAWQGSFITTRGITGKAAIAARLPEDMAHPVLEMESAAVALAANGTGIPFIGLRTVSDDASEELKFSLEEICDANGQVAIGRVVWLLARRPLLLAQFLRLAAGSAKAGQALGKALEKIVPLL